MLSHRVKPIVTTAILAALSSACGGGTAAGDGPQQQAATDPSVDATETSGDEAAAQSDGEEAGTAEGTETAAEPVDERHANLRLLDAIVAGEIPFSQLINRDDQGLLVVDNHDDDEGHLVQNAHHFCHGALSRRYEELTEQLRADLARGRELNDIACLPTPEGPPRTDCSMGGTETVVTTHYIFEEIEDGVRLESIYRISEIGKDERYISHAFRFADRQAAQVRRHGCR